MCVCVYIYIYIYGPYFDILIYRSMLWAGFGPQMIICQALISWTKTASYLGFDATSFRKNDQNLPFSSLYMLDDPVHMDHGDN